MARVARLRAHERGAVAALAALARPERRHERDGRRRRADGVAQGAGAQAVDDVDLVEARERGVVEVAIERLERLVDPGAAQVEGPRDRPRPLEPKRARRPTRSPSHRPVAIAVDPRVPADAGVADRRSATAGSRSSTSTVTRIPPDFERRPLAALLQRGDPALPAAAPAAGPLAEPPDVGAAGAARLGGGVSPRPGAAQLRLGPGDGRVEARRGDRLALERLARRADLVAQVGDEALGLGPRRSNGLVPLAPRARRRPRRPSRGLARARLGGPRPVSASLVSLGRL